MPDPVQPTPGSHEAAMIAKVDAQQAAMQALQGTPPVQDPPKDPPVTPPQDPPKDPPADPPKGDEKDPAADAAKAAGLDIGSLRSEFAEKGELSQASLDALAKAGIDKATVDSYIAGQAALAAQRDAEGFALVGGQEQFSTMTAWAAANMQPAEIEAFNKAVTGTAAEMKQAIMGLKASYEASLGSEPKLVSGSRQAAPEATPFASRTEVTAAMRDPRYRSDPAYRASVERRIGLMDNF